MYGGKEKLKVDGRERASKAEQRMALRGFCLSGEKIQNKSF